MCCYSCFAYLSSVYVFIGPSTSSICHSFFSIFCLPLAMWLFLSLSVCCSCSSIFSSIQRPRQALLLQIPFEISINRATSLLFVGLQVVSCKFCKVDGAFRMAFHHLVCSIYGNIQPKCI